MIYAVVTILILIAGVTALLIKLDTPAVRVLALTALNSGLLVCLGLICTIQVAPGKLYYALPAMFGLFLAFASDIALKLRNVLPENSNNCVLTEYICSMLSQLFYVVMLSCLSALSIYTVVITCVFLAAAFAFAKYLKLEMNMGAKTALIRIGIVSLLIGFAVSAAISEPGLLSALVCVGSVLLYVSTALRCYLELTQYSISVNRAIRLACYFASQAIFALSILIIGMS